MTLRVQEQKFLLSRTNSIKGHTGHLKKGDPWLDVYIEEVVRSILDGNEN